MPAMPAASEPTPTAADDWGTRLRAPFRVVGEHIGCELPGGRALFCTRRGGVSAAPFRTLNVGLATNDRPAAVEENRRRVAALIGIPQERWVQSRQVHGCAVRVVAEPPDPSAPPVEADGAATTLEGVAAVVVTGDCLPVALVARDGVAMLHAGWRGLAAGVLERGVEALRSAGAAGEIHAAIGPAIGVCCYEVDDAVHGAFARYPAQVARQGGRADLKGIARAQLAAAGVAPERIHDVGICTMCASPGLFHSHRRDSGRGGAARDTGRQASAVWRVVGDGGGGWPG